MSIVDGTLVPVRGRSIAAWGKNHRCATNLQVVIDANSRLVVAIGDPLPGSRNDCPAVSELGAGRGAAVFPPSSTAATRALHYSSRTVNGGVRSICVGSSRPGPRSAVGPGCLWNTPWPV